MIPPRNKMFRALKLSNLENLRSLQNLRFGEFKALKAFNLAMGTDIESLAIVGLFRHLITDTNIA